MNDFVRRVRDLVTGRWFFKSAFLVFFVYSVVQLFRFAAWARGEGPFVPRPEAPAGILPIGHFTSFYGWLKGGGWDTLLPAGLVIIIGAVALSLLFKRGFCGWICPVGTVWEAFSALGRRLFGKNFVLPKWLDIAARSLRYVMAFGFMAFVGMVSVEEAVGFRSLPYMWVADLKILGMMIDPLYVLVVLFVGAVSMFIGPLWCRYLCPLGGLYSAIGVASPCTIERNAEACIQCRKCAKVCHAYVEPNKTTRVWAPECDGCMDCVKVCPVDDCLEAKAFGRIRIAPWVWPLLVVGIWLTIYAAAKLTGNWDSSIPPQAFQQVINSGLLEQTTKGFF